MSEREVVLLSDSGILSKQTYSPLSKLITALEMIENGIKRSDSICLCLKRPSRGENQKYTELKIRLPGSTPRETWEFAVYLRVIKMLIENLQCNKVVTRRDLYYRDVELFKSQDTVNKCVENLCFTLEIDGLEIGAVPSLKGLVCGDFKIYDINTKEETHHMKSLLGPLLIPYLPSNSSEIKVPDSVKYILVVEKDAIFKTMCRSLNPERILITGKGYPDTLTKIFVSLLSKSLPQIPIYCLTDSDIYGLLIFYNYKYGPQSKDIQPNYQGVPNLHYLGVHLLDYGAGYLNISQKDYNMLRHYLTRCINLQTKLGDCDSSLDKVKKEAQRGMFLLKKCEMNVTDLVIDGSIKGIESYVQRRINLITGTRDLATP